MRYAAQRIAHRFWHGDPGTTDPAAKGSTVRLDPLPPESWTESFYDKAYFASGARGGYADYLGDEALQRIYARARIALACRFGAQPAGTWLDVGCAVGYSLDEARLAGFRVLGVEESA